MRARSLVAAAIFLSLVLSACGTVQKGGETALPTSMKEIPSGRLNYRYEPDVPPPAAPAVQAAAQQAINPAVQADFDASRPQEALDRTLASPDGKRILAIYHRAGDQPAEHRLDMYTGDGKILRRITPDSMAVHFHETIVWSPNSEHVAFVATVRAAAAAAPVSAQSPAAEPAANAAQPTPTGDANNPAPTPEPTIAASPGGAAPASVLTFRTEQIYLANADGDGLKPITQTEGLIYFYYVWAPDSSALAATAATAREWQIFQTQADLKGELFVPVGRARIVEKNGRERRLDDTSSAVQPVWSPDSSKVAVAFDMQVRVYDATGNAPTQAAIPLRNNLLLSSAAYDREQEKKLQESGVQSDTNGQPTPLAANTNSAEAPSTLPDPTTLVSFNPIVALNWPSDDLLYFQTAYIKRMKNEADSRSSFQRWHRLVFTPQP